MLSWGRVRRAIQPLILKYWLSRRYQTTVKTTVEGFELSVFPSVFHPRYFGSSAILAHFVSSLGLSQASFLDVGCGSGIVAMCAARAGARVTAVDINPEAVRCTLANAARHDLKIDTRLGDLFSSVDHARFDVIAWNPPFLPRLPSTPADAAFYGGPNFDVILRFARELRNHMKPNCAAYTILSMDVDVTAIEQHFKNQNFTVSRVLSKRWGLRETMVILCAR